MNEEEKYIGQMLEDRYEILETIGEGGMAIVFRALDHRLNRYVAVKIMREEMAKDEEFRRRFCAESHAVAMLSNPNIVSVYDVSHPGLIQRDGIHPTDKGAYRMAEIIAAAVKQ